MNHITTKYNLPGRSRKNCFVVMPFGKKPASQATGNGTDTPNREIDFDKIYDQLIKPVVEDELGLKCDRSDKISKTGMIQKDMIDKIIDADIVIVDITTNNANVFYELGVRHTVQQTGTVLIREKGWKIPFNISGLKAVDYELTNPATLAESKKILADYICASLQSRNTDSLVHTLVNDLTVSRKEKPMLRREFHSVKIPGQANKTLGFITGDIMNIDSVDLWVNAENTKMQMGRFYDGSVSANIRYYGAKRDVRGYVVKDIIADQLQRKLGNMQTVEPGMVIVTSSGELKKRNNVKAIFHIAAMLGEPGRGYAPIRQYANCVNKALRAAEQLNRNPLVLKRAKSILFPLFGSRSFGSDPELVALNLFKNALRYFERNPDCIIENVYFLAWTKRDHDICLNAIDRLGLNEEPTPHSNKDNQPSDQVD